MVLTFLEAVYAEYCVRTSKGIKPLGNCLYMLILSKLFTCKFLCIFMEIQVIDLPCNVH